MSDSREDTRTEFTRNAIIFAWSAPAAIAIFVVFYAVYRNIVATAAVVGEIDATTQTGLDMGWVVMIGGTGVFGVLAFVAGIRAARAWLRMRRDG